MRGLAIGFPWLPQLGRAAVLPLCVISLRALGASISIALHYVRSIRVFSNEGSRRRQREQRHWLDMDGSRLSRQQKTGRERYCVSINSFLLGLASQAHVVPHSVVISPGSLRSAGFLPPPQQSVPHQAGFSSFSGVFSPFLRLHLQIRPVPFCNLPSSSGLACRNQNTPPTTQLGEPENPAASPAAKNRRNLLAQQAALDLRLGTQPHSRA